MPRTGLILITLLIPGVVSAAPPPEKLLPADTLAAVIAPDGAAFVRAWTGTQFAALAGDPLMAPFVAEVDRELRHGPVLTNGMGITWSDIKSVVSGPMAVAMAPAANNRTALVAMIDTTGRRTARALLIARVAGSVVAHKGKVSFQPLAEHSVTVLAIPVDGGSRTVHVYELIKDDVLILSDNSEVMAALLQRWAKNNDSLADRKEFQAVQQRGSQPGGKAAYVTAFVDPVALASLRSPGGKKKRDVRTALSEEGFASVTAIGAAARLGDGPFDVLLKVAVHAPPPHDRALALLNFPNRSALEPPAWIPASTSRCLTFNCDLRGLPASFGFLFDYFTGKPGDLDAVLTALRDDPEGPRIDVPREVLGRLTGRVTYVGTPPGACSLRPSRALVAFEAREEQPLAQAVGRLLANDERVTKTSGRSIWVVTLRERDSDGRLAVAVARGQLWIANDPALLEAVLAGKVERRFANDPDYRRVQSELNALKFGERSFELLARPGEGGRGLWELARAGKLAESPSLAPPLLRELLEWVGLEAAATKLPEFEKIRRHFPPIGVVAITRPDGWDVTAFMLKPVESSETSK